MSNPSPTEVSAVRRGRPRSEKSHDAILQAAGTMLLDQGLDAVSMDALAEAAGVGKATIYRWWPTKESLALDALFDQWAQSSGPAPDTGSLQVDLEDLLLPWARRLEERPYARLLGSFIAKAHSDPEFAAEYRARIVTPRRETARPIFERAIVRGEAAPDIDIEACLDVVYGAVYHRLLHGHAPVTDRFVSEVIDIALHGVAVNRTRRKDTTE
jgi:AcrR family transcriptional regulator